MALTRLVALGVLLQPADEVVEIFLLPLAVFEGTSLQFGVVSLLRERCIVRFLDGVAGSLIYSLRAKRTEKSSSSVGVSHMTSAGPPMQKMPPLGGD